MFDDATIAAAAPLAVRLGVELAALLAVAEVESGGKAFALVDGRQEPLIRFEGHYFDRRLSPENRTKARALGLSSPKAGGVPNPASQAARWALLARAIEIDAKAAYESVSFGVGQVMGAHWQWLGFGSVTELVSLCRRDVAGQIDLMTRFIDKAGLTGAMRTRNWATFAKGYNGPAYKTNAYDLKLAAAYARNVRARPPAVLAVDHTVKRMQELLAAKGFSCVADGVRGPNTIAALKAFQKANRLVVDGVAGSATFAALER